MKVYKFGGASVKDASGVRNLKEIVACAGDDLMVVISNYTCNFGEATMMKKEGHLRANTLTFLLKYKDLQ